MASTQSRQKIGRPGIVESHPRRLEMEALLAAGIPAREVAERFNVSRSAVYRFWCSLPERYRACLVKKAAGVEGRRFREVAAELVAIGARHPAARADIEALACRLLAPPPAVVAPASHVE